MKPFEKTSVQSASGTVSINNPENPIQSATFDEEEVGSPVQLSETDIRDGPKLVITVVDGIHLPKGTKLCIDPAGLENSLRNKRDGLTFVGSQEKQGDESINDFIIPADEQGIGKRHLVIRYNAAKRRYAIKDLGEGTGTFAKLDSALALKNGYIISFGDSHMVVQMLGSSGEVSSNIAIRFLDGPKIDQTFTFSAEDSPVLIGRMVDCRIRFDDNSLSRYQCCVRYDQADGWMLSDGNGSKNSTNGTWLFVDDYFEIFDGMVFKAGQTLYECKFTPS